ncbi:uncharacterized protein LOC111818079 isoform X2 [Octodon degus]|uniref:Uncharacterized protein LOC111818079 isoform X2 n=1 Tax=Octodon degus TaxID=10160 RepID=A0A6P6EX21_OCTDE|nr:uncharacterized protein LOC111818079 isoform X2 [Octodon degus]
MPGADTGWRAPLQLAHPLPAAPHRAGPRDIRVEYREPASTRKMRYKRHSTCDNHAYAATQLVRKRQRANQEASGSPQPTAQPDLLEPPSRRRGNSRGGGGWRGARARLSAPSLAPSLSSPAPAPSRSLSLCSLPSFASLRSRSSLPRAPGRRFRKRNRSRFQTRQRETGDPAEARGKIGIATETPSPQLRAEEGGGGRTEASLHAVQVLIALAGRGLNPLMLLFFLKERVFLLSY